MKICKKKRSINITFFKKNLPKICMFKNVLVLKKLHVIMPYPLKKKCYHQIQESSLLHYISMILRIFKRLPWLQKQNIFLWKSTSGNIFFILKDWLKVALFILQRILLLPAIWLQNRAQNLLSLISFLQLHYSQLVQHIKKEPQFKTIFWWVW